MSERSRTVVRCAVGQTEEFNVEVGLHQGSSLSHFLFAIVMDQLSEEVRQESPWTMMFADDIVICSESREQVEENLERWRFALERRGMKVSRSKTEYMCVNEREGSGTVRLQGEEVKKVQECKYLGSTVQSNGECDKEDLTWSLNTSSITKKAQQHLYFLQRLRKAHLLPLILTTFYRGTIESILSSCITAWFGNCTVSDRKTLLRIVRTAEKIIGVSLPSIMDIYSTRCIHKASSIVDDPTHLSHTLFTLLPSGKRLWIQWFNSRTGCGIFVHRFSDLNDPAVVMQKEKREVLIFIPLRIRQIRVEQVGCELEEKERFWSELDEVMESIPTGERVVIGADFNDHVGEGNRGDEEVMGKFGVKERNLEGQMVVDFVKRMDMGVVNTYFQKREEFRVTYNSGGSPKAVVSITPDTHVFIGESVTLRCDIQGGGDTQWTYSLKKNNNGLYIDGNERFYRDRTRQVFSIWSVKDSDSGTYTCRGHGSDFQSSEISDAVTLTVSGP
ncbi:hypothetical protein QTP70_000788 [Hemibagrus guttatus]|uniref:ribonuclease H n=1 Tax=Hemibagrus guttatus TaxID=175788 RepID=A0AAE0R7U5_9TELE|nr:hypothetical protein QTP70_000788 [Hemibagrus guttatus]